MLGDDLPEAVAREVWSRRAIGHPPAYVSVWLARMGYVVMPDEIDSIASWYAVQRDAHQTDSELGRPP